MGLITSIFFIVLITALIATRLVQGIDYMDKNYPNYKGHDLFDEGEEEENLDEDEKTKTND